MSILYTAILTFIGMLLGHYLYNYLKNNYTIPKIEKIYTIDDELTT
jgi:hypothetical protein